MAFLSLQEVVWWGPLGGLLLCLHWREFNEKKIARIYCYYYYYYYFIVSAYYIMPILNLDLLCLWGLILRIMNVLPCACVKLELINSPFHTLQSPKECGGTSGYIIFVPCPFPWRLCSTLRSWLRTHYEYQLKIQSFFYQGQFAFHAYFCMHEKGYLTCTLPTWLLKGRSLPWAPCLEVRLRSKSGQNVVKR